MPDAKFCRRCGTSSSQQIIKDGDLSAVVPEQMSFVQSQIMNEGHIEMLQEVATVSSRNDL